MPQKILGIDLGSWSVKAVLVETSFRSFEVAQVREVKVTPGEAETRRERQLAALRQLVTDPSLKADVQIVGFPGESVTTRFITLPFSDEKRIEQTISGELADSLPFELGDSVFDHTMLKKLPDGGSLSLAAVAMRDAVAGFLAGVQSAGIDPKHLPVDVLQLFNLYTAFLGEDQSKPETPVESAPEAGTFITNTPDGLTEARLILDIGHERTLVSAASNEGLAFIRVLRAGGRDVTAAIARAFGVTPEAAEEAKHAEALVASLRHPAPTDAAQRMAEVCSEGLHPLVKELRRTLQSIRSEKRVRISRVDLVGGGSRIRNLANHLAEQLNVPVAAGVAVEQPVERLVEASRRPAFAAALAYALRGSGDDRVQRIDLRVGDFAFAGQLKYLRDRMPFIGAAAALLIGLVSANVYAQYHVIRAREAAIDRQFCEITQKVLGKEVCEPMVALSMMKQPATDLGSFRLPERSAFRVAADVSGLIPQGTEVLISELDITPDRVRISGETVSFDAVDQIVAEYEKDSCLTEIKKGKLRKKSDGKGVEFQLSIKLVCSS